MKKVLIILIFVYGFKQVLSQDSTKYSLIGAGLEYYYSVNGHGAFISPHISYTKGKHQLKLGPAIHKRTMMLKGAKLSYAFLLAGMDGEEKFSTDFRENRNGTWRVNLVSYLQFVDYTALSYARAREETLVSTDSTTDWNKVYLSTFEAGLGAEIDVKLFNYLQLRTYIGISVYSHLNHPSSMYQEKTGASFVTGIGVNVPGFKKAGKK